MLKEWVHHIKQEESGQKGNLKKNLFGEVACRGGTSFILFPKDRKSHIATTGGRVPLRSVWLECEECEEKTPAPDL